jgi:gluconate 2-dehydrogenase alpha chain
VVAVLPKVDVVFVGFGMVGGIVASELTKRASGLRMVGLERGPFRTTNPDFLMDHFDEFRYAVQGQMFQDLSRETWTFRNDVQGSALPVRQYGAWLPGNGVGGAMVHWNGQLWRFLDYFFEYRTHLEQRYGASFLPADTTIQDWGITYAELEAYYTQFDKTFGIAGKAGNVQGVIQPGGNPFEGPRSEEYPQPPNQIAYGPTLFKQASDELGFKTFPQPTANSPQVYTNPDGQVLAPCNYCGFCERFGCHVGAKASPITTVIPTALASGRVEVREYSNVFRINTAGGQATSVSYFDAAGQEQEQPADLIVIGAFTLSNIRLLLLSQIGQPYDPRANTGVVGRNFTYQVGGASAVGWYDDRILNRFMGSGANGYCIDELNSDNFDHSDLRFFGGGNISCNDTAARPIQSFGPLPPGTPTWGSGFKAGLKQYYNRSFSFAMQGECPAYRQNYVDLDPTYNDAWGHPLPRVTFNFTDNERKMVKYVADNAITQIVGQMSPAIMQVSDTITDFNSVPYQSTHINGGTVMGDDPNTSVVNKYCQVRGVPNLFVVGASNFPQHGGYNPTGTAGALAYHTADALVTRYLPDPGMLARPSC